MDFFDLFSSKRRKQKNVDRFLLQMLAAQSDGYEDVLTAAFGKIRKLSHALPGDGKELMISYAKDVPLLDCPNGDSPFCSFKTNYGWIDFHVLYGKILFVNLNFTACSITLYQDRNSYCIKIINNAIGADQKKSNDLFPVTDSPAGRTDTGLFARKLFVFQILKRITGN